MQVEEIRIWAFQQLASMPAPPGGLLNLKQFIADADVLVSWVVHGHPEAPDGRD